ncbi:MAG TPA: DUF3999 family protein [Pyrinomonadaceae bacterium]|nr:DUF3999 family protein [Pyrinomonadaceae bacterium]
MKKHVLVLLLVVVACILPSFIPAFAQASISAWPFFAEVNLPSGASGTYDLVVPLQVMDKSREDLADLRLQDHAGRELPYALRIRKEVDEQREIAARVFNQVMVSSKTSEVSLDLDENAGDHNQVEIQTAGTNFRRRVDVEGSDSGKEWKTLKSGDLIFRFEGQHKVVESSRVSYSTSRYRYLRVRVFADELTDKEAPPITGVKVMMADRETGELTTWSVAVPSYQLLRNQGAPASAWTIDLGARVPCDRLIFEVHDDAFSRTFQIEVLDDPQNIRWVTAGELTRRIGEQRRPLVINFEKEEHARKLRLLVTDYSNQTLSISSIKAAAPTRQLIFELKEGDTQPLRLFFGNLKATAPHYDFEKALPLNLSTMPIRSEVGGITSNPEYTPEPLPFTERAPWLIYLVLAVSSVALALILLNLIRTTVKTTPQPKEPNPPGSIG